MPYSKIFFKRQTIKIGMFFYTVYNCMNFILKWPTMRVHIQRLCKHQDAFTRVWKINVIAYLAVFSRVKKFKAATTLIWSRDGKGSLHLNVEVDMFIPSRLFILYGLITHSSCLCLKFEVLSSKHSMNCALIQHSIFQFKAQQI